MTTRTSPVEAEQSVLGGVMLDNLALPEAREVVSEGDFTDPRHRLVWRAIVALEAGRVDEVSVTSQLRARGDLEKAGGAMFVSELVERIPTAANITSYLEVMRKASAIRTLYATARKLQKDIEGGAELDEVLSTMAAVARQVEAREPEQLHDIAIDLKAVTDEMAKRETTGAAQSSDSFIPTGFSDLDKLLIGYGQGQLLIVTAKSGVGKTAFAINTAKNQVVLNGSRIGFFSGEMSRKSIARRLLACSAPVEHHVLRDGLFNGNEWPRAIHALGAIQSRQSLFMINDTVQTIGQVCGLALRAHAAARFDVIYVDYLQHLVPRGGKSFNREIDVAGAASDLKNLARKLGCAVVVLSQMNKEGGLRESEAILHVADVVLEIDRPWIENKEKDELEANVILRKQRDGAQGGSVRLEYHAKQVRFQDAQFVPKATPARTTWHEKTNDF